ncbi:MULTISPECIES: hypothetical protein [unclassified Sinorhizobium]|uniref:hypothetical protein n=1 Tax=unclassified Sinorhizobium TaxID=2613772 RepID=UPI00352535D8
MGKFNPYIRIMLAADKGVGVRLSAQEVAYLAQDSAIAKVSDNTMIGLDVDGGGFFVTKSGFEPKEPSR